MALFGVYKQAFHDLKRLPDSIKSACFNVGIFTLGWGLGADTFLPIYINRITDNLFLVGLLSAFIALVKLSLNIPIGQMDGRVDERKMLRIGKIIYIMAGLLFFLAGLYKSIIILVLALFVTGTANPFVYTTTLSYIRQHSSTHNACTVFGLYNFSIGLFLGVGSLIAAILVKYIDLHWMYLFVVLFSFISLPLDKKLPERKGKPIVQEFKKVLFKQNVYKQSLAHLKNHNKELYLMLFVYGFWGLLDYISLIFIPILALRHNLNLPQIAIIFAVMNIPYVLSFLFTDIADRRGKTTVLGVSAIITALLLGILGNVYGFIPIILTSIALILCLSVIRAVSSGVITNLVVNKERSEITGIQEFVARGGNIIGATTFGLISEAIGINNAFNLLAILIGVLSMSIFHIRIRERMHFISRFFRRNKDKNEPVIKIYS